MSPADSRSRLPPIHSFQGRNKGALWAPPGPGWVWGGPGSGTGTDFPVRQACNAFQTSGPGPQVQPGGSRGPGAPHIAWGPTGTPCHSPGRGGGQAGTSPRTGAALTGKRSCRLQGFTTPHPFEPILLFLSTQGSLQGLPGLPAPVSLCWQAGTTAPWMRPCPSGKQLDSDATCTRLARAELPELACDGAPPQDRSLAGLNCSKIGELWAEGPVLDLLLCQGGGEGLRASGARQRPRGVSVGWDGMGYDGLGWNGMGRVSPVLLRQGSAGSGPASWRPHVPALPQVWNPFASPAAVFSQQDQSGPAGLGAALAPWPICSLFIFLHLSITSQINTPRSGGAGGISPPAEAGPSPWGAHHPVPSDAHPLATLQLGVPGELGWGHGCDPKLRPCPLCATCPVQGPVCPLPTTHA